MDKRWLLFAWTNAGGGFNDFVRAHDTQGEAERAGKELLGLQEFVAFQVVDRETLKVVCSGKWVKT